MSKNSTKPSLEILPDDSILKGVALAIQNADDLIKDAVYLKGSRRWSRAYTLCQLAIEECGKAGLLMELFVYRTFFNVAEEGDFNFEKQIDYDKMNKAFYNHQPKTKKIVELQIELLKVLLPNAKEYDVKIVDDWIHDLNKDLDSISKFDLLKNESLYVSFESAGFSSPSQKITEKMFVSIHDKAVIYKTILAFIASNMNKHFFLLMQAFLKTGNLKAKSTYLP